MFGSDHIRRYMPIQVNQPSEPQKDKVTNVDDIYLRTFPKKKFFAAARMRFIFVTRCAGNKALFIWPLPVKTCVNDSF